MIRFVIPLLPLLVVACTATSPDSYQSKTELNEEEAALLAQHNETASEKEQVVCKYEKVTGSNMMSRICRTVRRMEEDREDARKLLRRSSIARGTGDN